MQVSKMPNQQKQQHLSHLPALCPHGILIKHEAFRRAEKNDENVKIEMGGVSSANVTWKHCIWAVASTWLQLLADIHNQFLIELLTRLIHALSRCLQYILFFSLLFTQNYSCTTLIEQN